MRVVKIDGLRFECLTKLELWRAQTMMTKEPGTVQWLEDALCPGDVFYDIGANIGIYTIRAARLVGPRGTVVAFEPSAPNLVALARNIAANGFRDRVVVVSTPLHNVSTMARFNYASDMAGASGGQLGHHTDEHGHEFVPTSVELKWATTLDAIAERLPHRPRAIKLDVDGNEFKILNGATALLRGERRPESVQVEVHKDTAGPIAAFMSEHGYNFSHLHHTANGKQAIKDGHDPSKVPHNQVFAVSPTSPGQNA